LLGACLPTVLLQIGTNQSSAVRRQPVLFFCVINQGIFAALVR
jgi:ATP-binding cassette subfamily G (WHITE) protein 2